MKGGLEAPPETKRGAPLRARSCALVSGLVLLWCLPMERATNAAVLLNEELRAPCHCTDEANRAEDTDQRATIELPRAPTPFEDAVPTTLPEQRAEGTSGKEPPRPGAAAPACCSVVPVAPPLPLTLLQLVLLAVVAWRRAPRGNTSTARAVLPTLLCLLVPKALAHPTHPTLASACGGYQCEWGKDTEYREDGLYVQGSMQDGHSIYGKYLRLGPGTTVDYNLCCDICTSQAHDGVSYPLFSDVARTIPATCVSHALRYYDTYNSGQHSGEHKKQPLLTDSWFCTFHTSGALLTPYAQGGNGNGFNSVRGCRPLAVESPSPPPSPPPPSPSPPLRPAAGAVDRSYATTASGITNGAAGNGEQSVMHGRCEQELTEDECRLYEARAARAQPAAQCQRDTQIPSDVAGAVQRPGRHVLLL